MKIKWYGQACMVIESVDGVRIMCDPYDDSVGYSLPDKEVIDIVTISHDHFDHNAVDTIMGTPKTFREDGEFIERGIKIIGVHTWHDTEEGGKRGGNIAYKFVIDNINFIHLGDIGHILTEQQVKCLTPCDILAVPVGGVFTVDAAGAQEIVKQLNPRIVIPIHYDTPSNKVGLNSADTFMKGFMEVKREKIWTGVRSDIPNQIVVWMLKAHGER